MSNPSTLQTIGILGAGRVGTAVARQALKAGYNVKIATAKPVEEISMIVDIVTPGAQAVETAEVARQELVILAVPLHKYRTVDPHLLAGKTVIDVMNYWPAIDGELADFEDDPRTSSEIIQGFLQDAVVVKSLNHIGYHELEEDDQPVGTEGRRALAIASDDAAATELVAGFIDRLGYDPINAGPLAAGRAFQPGTTIFNGSHTGAELTGLLDAAVQHSHS